MKRFFTYLLATIVGIIISSAILFFISMGIISAMVASQNKAIEIKPNSVLYLKFDQPIVDRQPNMPFSLAAITGNQRIGLNEILANIEKAKNDDNISGIYLDLSFMLTGYSTVEEIRNALLDFQTSGKFVIANGKIYSQKAYYLATAADAVYLNPAGFLEWVGLHTQSSFFKNTLKKLDIEATVVRYGKYKSAAENFTEEGYSPENRIQIKQLISGIWKNICNNVSVERGIAPEKLNQIADKLLVNSPYSAYQLGMVDSILYDDQVLAIIKNRIGIDSSKNINTVELAEYRRVPVHHTYKGLAKDKIAVIYASGEIIERDGDDQTIEDDKFAETIRKARKDSSIKAIVLRVNSPGGSALASEVIWHELDLTRAVKPIVVSMGDVAASGGYYISCIADTILAQPSTITGSIGVIGMYLNMQGMFKKVGITFDTEKTNTYSDFLSGVRPVTQYELNYWQNRIDSTYVTFVRRVNKGRALNFDQIEAIGQGRVWSGVDAIENGLVDKIGGLNDAIEMAKNMAGLDEKYRIVELPKLEDPVEKIMRELVQGVKIRIFGKDLDINEEYFNILKKYIKNTGILARMPFDIEIL